MICIKCGESNVDNFYLSSLKEGGWHICKRCKYQYDKSWNKKNPEKIREIVNRWNKNHPEQARTFWNRAFDKWYENHKEEHYAKTSAYARANPQRHKAQCYAFARYPETQICEIDGCLEQGQRHHDDYSKPFEIRWLCRKHHKEEHKNLKVLCRG